MANFRDLKYPLPSHKLIGVRYNPANIIYIDNPTPEMVQTVIDKDPRYLAYIDVPLGLQTKLKLKYNDLFYIRNLPEEVQEKLLDKSRSIYSCIAFSANIQMHCLVNDKYIFNVRSFVIPNLCEAAQIYLLKNVEYYEVDRLIQPNYIDINMGRYVYILDPLSIEVQRLIAYYYPSYRYTIPNASETVLMELVKKDGTALKHILNEQTRHYFKMCDTGEIKYHGLFLKEDVEVCVERYKPVVNENILIAAVSQNPAALEFIDNPSGRVRKVARRNVARRANNIKLH